MSLGELMPGSACTPEGQARCVAGATKRPPVGEEDTSDQLRDLLDLDGVDGE